ncbi:MAG TPA: N-6 DNA methylase [Candidatus Omnitrophota bacterium]|nr:N-6 DNA methylase [Candidatus Omnitrophota bacterium]
MKTLASDNLFSTSIEVEYTRNTSVEYRRSKGQFFTPFDIAEFMAEWIVEDRLGQKLRILDPACGFGVFERAIAKVYKGDTSNLLFDLWEIDEKILCELRMIVSDLDVKADFYHEDFLSNGEWDKYYDGIIANPPYYKHHYIDNKQKIFERVCVKSNYIFSIQTNIYCWFLIKSLQLLKEGGRLAFIVPSEFLNSNYGEKIKSYLIQSGLICHLINVHFKENVFEDALTTSVIILAERNVQIHKTINFYTVHDAAYLTNLSSFLKEQKHKAFVTKNLDPKIKWRNYFNGYKDHFENSDKVVPFVTFGRFSRGIATGSNNYFTLSKLEVEKHRIPSECLLSCITKSSFAKSRRFGIEDFQSLVIEGKKVFLFDGNRAKTESVAAYLKLGVNEGVDQKFLTKCRDPWYSLEKRECSKIWVSVFGRNGLKFIWNESDCLNLTCFHAFSTTQIGEEYLGIIYLYLNTSIAHYFLEKEKREYGNGLEKYEPNDINKTMIPDFRKLDKTQKAKLQDLFQKLILGKDEKKVVDEADRIIRGLIE